MRNRCAAMRLVFRIGVVFVLSAAWVGARGQTTLFFDDFDGPTRPEWQVMGGGDYVWGPNTTKSASRKWSMFCASGSNRLRTRYINAMNTQLILRDVSLSNCLSAALIFKHWINVESSPTYDFDYLDVYVEAQEFTQHRRFDNRNGAGWRVASIDLTPYVGSDRTIVFDFQSNRSVVPNEPSGVWIDDVQIVGVLEPAERFIGNWSTDFDGDGLDDMAVYHAAQGDWYIRQSGNGQLRRQNWGWSETLPVPADYDGDKRADIAVFHPATGNWYIRQSSNGQSRVQNWGWSEVMPVPADYDGDGVADLAVYHPAAGVWYIRQSSNGQMRQQNWGWNETLPVPADYDGDSKADLAVYYRNSGMWYILQSSDGQMRQQQFFSGWSAAIPLPRDYDGDRKADLAIYHRRLGFWNYFSSRYGFAGDGITFGWSETIPVPGKYDVSTASSFAVYHPASGTWYVLPAGVPPSQPYQRNWGWSAALPVFPLY